MPRLEAESRAGRGGVGELLADRFVLGELLAVGLELNLGQSLYVGAEEQLQQRGVSEHVRLGGEGSQPVRERRLTAVGERVELAPATVGLLLLGEVAAPRQARGL